MAWASQTVAPTIPGAISFNQNRHDVLEVRARPSCTKRDAHPVPCGTCRNYGKNLRRDTNRPLKLCPWMPVGG